jgi:hypothetical protein
VVVCGEPALKQRLCPCLLPPALLPLSRSYVTASFIRPYALNA